MTDVKISLVNLYTWVPLGSSSYSRIILYSCQTLLGGHLQSLQPIRLRVYQNTELAESDLQALCRINTREKQRINGALPILCWPHSGPGRGSSRKTSSLSQGLDHEQHSSWKKGGLPPLAATPFKSTGGLVNHYLCPVETVLKLTLHPLLLP